MSDPIALGWAVPGLGVGWRKSACQVGQRRQVNCGSRIPVMWLFLGEVGFPVTLKDVVGDQCTRLHTGCRTGVTERVCGLGCSFPS